MRKVIGIGETILDIIFQNDQPQKAVPGGSTFNCMVSLGRCLIPNAFVSELGDDKVGELIKNFMKENNLSSEHINFYKNRNSPIALAFLDENQNAEYQFFRNFPSKRLNISFPEINKDDVVVFGSYFAVDPKLRGKVLELLQYAKTQKAIIYYDINFRRAHEKERDVLMPDFRKNFEYSSIVRCSDEDLKVLFPGKSINQVYEEEIAPVCKNFIVTKGDKGIILKTALFEKEYSVKPLIPVSTIGAGDNFNAGLIYGMMQENYLPERLFSIEEKQWDCWIDYGQKFASEVCKSMENYVPIGF